MMNPNGTFIIEAIERDTPYFSFAYVKDFQDGKIQWTRKEQDAKELFYVEVKPICNEISSYRNKGLIDIIPFVYQMTENGKERIFDLTQF